MNAFEYPYRHIKCYNFLPIADYQSLIGCLPKLEWEEYDRDGYKYNVCSIDYENECYKSNKEIVERFISGTFIKNLSDLLQLKLSECRDFTFHKMDIGDYSSKHTDINGHGEAGRVVFYLSDSDSYGGGELKLYDKNGTGIHEIIKMPPNSFFAFRLTDAFYHEVKRIESGTRYCISISYC